RDLPLFGDFLGQQSGQGAVFVVQYRLAVDMVEAVEGVAVIRAIPAHDLGLVLKEGIVGIIRVRGEERLHYEVPDVHVTEPELFRIEGRWIVKPVGLLPRNRRVRQIAFLRVALENTEISRKRVLAVRTCPAAGNAVSGGVVDVEIEVVLLKGRPVVNV